MRFRNLMAAASVGAAMLAASAVPASATVLTFSVAGSGQYSVNSGSFITSLVTQKTIPSTEFVNQIGLDSDPNAATLAGISAIFPGTLVTFSALTLPTVNGPFAFTVTAGNLVFSFTDVKDVQIVATTNSSQGSISESFLGTVTGDTSVGQTFLGQTVSLSEACTQVQGTSIAGAISCTESFSTPSAVKVPEPMSIALLGSGLLASGAAFRRRRKPAAKQA